MDAVSAYFDEKAKNWDTEAHTESPVQGAVARLAGVCEGVSVLDLGCGTGVMVDVYLDLGASRVLGIDVSSKMIEVANEKYAADDRVSFMAIDAIDIDASDCFDSVVIYNAYPHFMDRPALASKVAQCLVPGGRFVVAHGMGKDVINSHHGSVPENVTLGLRSAEEESGIWSELFELDALVDTPFFYAISGRKR